MGWQNYDIYTNKAVPKSAIAHIVIASVNTTAARTVGVRTDGSALNRYVKLHEGEAGGAVCASMYVKVDASTGYIETYCDSTTGITFYLMGYWTGVTYTELMQTLTIDTATAWTDIDLSAYMTDGYVAEIMLCNRQDGAAVTMGVRTNSSSLERSVAIHEAESASVETTDCTTYTMCVKTDASGVIDYYTSSTTTVDFILIGYFGSEITYTELMVTGSSASTGWQDWDLTDSLDQDGRVCEILSGNAARGVEYNFGCRVEGSGLNRYILIHESETNGNNGFVTACGTDANGILEMYLGNASNEFFRCLGYFKSLVSDITVNDTSSVMETINVNKGAITNEDCSFSDSILSDKTTVLSDTFSLGDINYYERTMFPLDSIIASDSIYLNKIMVLSDIINLSDSVSAITGMKDAKADTAQVGYSEANVMFSFDASYVGEIILKLVSVLISDSSSLSDINFIDKNFIEVDSIAAIDYDSVSKLIIEIDAAALLESLSLNKTLITTDIVGGADALLLNKSLILLEAALASDSIFSNKAFTVSDTSTIVDSVLAHKTLILSDLSGASDTKLINKTLLPTDLVSLAEIIIKFGAGQHTISDTASLLDSVLISKDLDIVVDSGLLLDEYRVGKNIVLQDTSSLLELPLVNKNLVLLDSVAGTDSKILDAAKHLLETVGLGDIKYLNKEGKILDIMQLAEALAAHKHLPISDAMLLSEVFSTIRGLSEVEGISLEEAIAVFAEKKVIDIVLSSEEAIREKLAMSVVDDVGLQDMIILDKVLYITDTLLGMDSAAKEEYLPMIVSLYGRLADAYSLLGEIDGPVVLGASLVNLDSLLGELDYGRGLEGKLDYIHSLYGDNYEEVRSKENAYVQRVLSIADVVGTADALEFFKTRYIDDALTVGEAFYVMKELLFDEYLYFSDEIYAHKSFVFNEAINIFDIVTIDKEAKIFESLLMSDYLLLDKNCILIDNIINQDTHALGANMIVFDAPSLEDSFLLNKTNLSLDEIIILSDEYVFSLNMIVMENAYLNDDILINNLSGGVEDINMLADLVLVNKMAILSEGFSAADFEAVSPRVKYISDNSYLGEYVYLTPLILVNDVCSFSEIIEVIYSSESRIDWARIDSGIIAMMQSESRIGYAQIDYGEISINPPIDYVFDEITFSELLNVSKETIILENILLGDKTVISLSDVISLQEVIIVIGDIWRDAFVEKAEASHSLAGCLIGVEGIISLDTIERDFGDFIIILDEIKATDWVELFNKFAFDTLTLSDTVNIVFKDRFISEATYLSDSVSVVPWYLKTVTDILHASDVLPPFPTADVLVTAISPTYYSVYVYKTGNTTYYTTANAAITAAFNLLTPTRTTKEKVLLKYTFPLTSAISIPNYTILELNGTATRSAGCIYTTSKHDIEVQGGTWVCTSAVLPKGNLYFNTCDYVIVQNCTIDYSLLFDDCRNVDALGNSLTSPGRIMFEAIGRECYNGRFIDNKINKSGSAVTTGGIYIYCPDDMVGQVIHDCEIAHNEIYRTSVDGISIYTNDMYDEEYNMDIHHNYLEDCGVDNNHPAISLGCGGHSDPDDNGYVHDCDAYENTIVITGTTYTDRESPPVTDNICGGGIHIRGDSNNVYDNTITTIAASIANRSPISIKRGYNNKIYNNEIYGCGTIYPAIQLVEATYCQIYDNLIQGPLYNQAIRMQNYYVPAYYEDSHHNEIYNNEIKDIGSTRYWVYIDNGTYYGNIFNTIVNNVITGNHNGAFIGDKPNDIEGKNLCNGVACPPITDTDPYFVITKSDSYSIVKKYGETTELFKSLDAYKAFKYAYDNLPADRTTNEVHRKIKAIGTFSVTSTIYPVAYSTLELEGTIQQTATAAPAFDATNKDFIMFLGGVYDGGGAGGTDYNYSMFRLTNCDYCMFTGYEFGWTGTDWSDLSDITHWTKLNKMLEHDGGGSGAPGTGRFLTTYDCNHLTLRWLYIHEGRSGGDILYASNSVLHGCLHKDNYSGCYFFTEDDDTIQYCENNIMSYNEVWNTENSGLSFSMRGNEDESNDNEFAYNRIFYCGQDGVHTGLNTGWHTAPNVRYSKRTKIHNNYIIGNSSCSSGIDVNGIDHEVYENELTNCGDAGIVYHGDGAKIHDNIIDGTLNSGSYGIGLWDGDTAEVYNNIISNTKSHPIWILSYGETSGSKNNDIHDNTITKGTGISTYWISISWTNLYSYPVCDGNIIHNNTIIGYTQCYNKAGSANTFYDNECNGSPCASCSS
jgi:hypothetical protein